MGEPPFYSDKDDGDDDHAANDDDVDVNDDDGGDDDDDRSTRIREEPPFYFVLVSCPSSSPAALPACASSKSPTTTSSSSSQETANWCVCFYLLLLATILHLLTYATTHYNYYLLFPLISACYHLTMMASVIELGMRVARAWEEHCMKGETSIYGSGTALHIWLSNSTFTSDVHPSNFSSCTFIICHWTRTRRWKRSKRNFHKEGRKHQTMGS